MPDWAWISLARADGGRWAIPERDAAGEVIGTAYRYPDGRKDFAPGGKRGLIVAWPLPPYAGATAADPVFIGEGASDTGALLGLSLDAVGVPMAGHSGAMLADLLAGRHVVIVADADKAGRDGSAKIAGALAGRCASVRIIEPPCGAKDARAAVIAGANRDDFTRAAAAAQPWTGEAAAPGTTPTGYAPVMVRLSDVTPERIAWLWPGRIALGKLTLIAGDPGLGKSFLTLDMAARVSRGAPWPDAPDAPQAPGGTVLLSAEDGVADTIRPRLDAAGADCSRIVAIQAVRQTIDADGKQTERHFDLAADLPALEQAIREVEGCRLVVIDPVTAYLGAVDSHKNAEIRGLLAPLARLAAAYGVAIVLVDHLNKATGRAAIYRTMGSIGTVAASRAAWGVVKDKADPRRRLLLPIKSNLAPDTGGLAYTFQAVEGHEPPALAWELNPVSVTADDALAAERDSGSGRTEREDAADWLRDFLADGPRKVADVETESKAAGISPATLRRAKAALGVESRKPAWGGSWEWALPPAGASGDAPPEDAHSPKALTEDAHSPASEHLGAKQAGNNGIHPKMLTPAGVSALGEHLGGGERLGGEAGPAPESLRIPGPCNLCRRSRWWRPPGSAPGEGWTCGECHPPFAAGLVEWAGAAGGGV